MKPAIKTAECDVSVRLSGQYVAGFIDGEGCLRINRPRITKSGKIIQSTISISVSNTNYEILAILKEMYGGSLIKTNRGPRCKDCFIWHIEAKKAERVLIDIKDYLVIKRRQCEILMDFRTSLKNGNIMTRGLGHNRNPQKDKKILQFRSEAILKIDVLNKRGKDEL